MRCSKVNLTYKFIMGERPLPEIAENKVWESWNGNIVHPYSKKYDVQSEADIVEAVLESDHVRFFGSKQSSADICAGTKALIDLTHFNQMISIDQEQKRITFQSGIKLSDALDIIHTQGWCLPCLPDINTITLGGAISTASHGTGKTGQTLSEYMVACRLVLADGFVKEFTETDAQFAGIRVSLGVLGVFSSITLQCQEDYTLYLQEGPMKDDEWLANLPSLMQKNDFLRVLFLPHAGSSYVIQGNKVDPNQTHELTKPVDFLKHRRSVSKFLYQYTHRFPRFTVLANKLIYKLFFTYPKTAKGNLYDATVTKSRGSTLELSEFTIGLDKFQKVFGELREMLKDPKSKTYIHIPMDVRFIKADNSWLSYAYGQDTVTVGCVCRNTAQADSYHAFKTVEALFLKHGGRPHWAKRFSAKAPELSKLYPKWNDFLELREQFDPKGKFLNQYLSEVFGV